MPDTLRASLFALVGGLALVALVVLIAAGVLVGAAAVLAPLFDLSGNPSTGNWIGRL